MALCLICFQVLIILSFLQHSLHGGTLLAQYDSSTKECTFYCSIPNFYNKPSISTLVSNTHDDVYSKTEIDT